MSRKPTEPTPFRRLAQAEGDWIPTLSLCATAPAAWSAVLKLRILHGHRIIDSDYHMGYRLTPAGRALFQQLYGDPHARSAA